MPVPSRIFVGVTVFGLIATLLVAPYTILVVSGYEASPDAPYQVLFPDQEGHSVGDKAFLVVASLFCVLLLVYGWRSLLRAARRDAEIRKAILEGRIQPPTLDATGRSSGTSGGRGAPEKSRETRSRSSSESSDSPKPEPPKSDPPSQRSDRNDPPPGYH